ncbi:MAG: acetylornithine deacetylase [Pseudomonadales bacterium]|nr:acetylornithine deacetylase [Pseudomonadales bacterium]MBO6655419.1 acetylornithine deacetylase [Pseudomonadales bacterium]MBO6701157.1 acetylornithine deacetylase [Pseudomonadales bacterium]MBO7004996.1 acetylornithine deacetylase [Pseudomonadales bacterium]
MKEPRYTPRQMLEKLIAFPTVSRDSNLDLIIFVEEYLAAYGVPFKRVSSDCGQKANLYATIGPMEPGGVVLSGHTDVVPIDDQDWHTDPFKLTEKDGLLYGRGTCDMKAFSAIALALVPEMSKLKRPIHLALSYDEEVGCLGAPRLIDTIKNELPGVRAVFVGEPTSMQVVTGHKSILHFDTRITGREAHSSQQHRGVPAVMVAGRLINWLSEKQRANAANADPLSAFEPPYSTLHCGVIHGGTALNITARHCDFVTDIRTLPHEDAMTYFREYEDFVRDVVEPEMHAVSSDTGIEIEIHANVPGFDSPENGEAVQLAKQLSGQNTTVVAPYAAESGQFQKAGFSVAMCGPGSIDQAHQPDEYISIEQLEQGTEFTRRLIQLQSS